MERIARRILPGVRPLARAAFEKAPGQSHTYRMEKEFCKIFKIDFPTFGIFSLYTGAGKW